MYSTSKPDDTLSPHWRNYLERVKQQYEPNLSRNGLIGEQFNGNGLGSGCYHNLGSGMWRSSTGGVRTAELR